MTQAQTRHAAADRRAAWQAFRACVVRMPGFPVMQIAGVLLIAAVLVTMGLDKDWQLSWVAGVPWLVLLTLIYWVRRAVTGRAAAPAGAAGPSTPP